MSCDFIEIRAFEKRASSPSLNGQALYRGRSSATRLTRLWTILTVVGIGDFSRIVHVISVLKKLELVSFSRACNILLSLLLSVVM